MVLTREQKSQLAYELAAEALDLRASARVEYLDRVCGADHSLRAEVDYLLALVEQPGIVDPTGSLNLSLPGLHPSELIDNRWKIIQHIASGGMGDVYEVEDQFQRNRRVALKAILPEIATDPRMMIRFKQEVRIGQEVTDRNVCRVYELGYHRAQPDGSNILYMTMELLRPGETMSRVIKERRFSTEQAFPIVRQIVCGLSALHRAGYVHRDLKPANIMVVDREGEIERRAVITDLGLARHLVEGHSAEAALVHKTGRSGTPEYMAPEQLTGGELSTSTDIYSLGLIMYEMVTSTLPFRGSNRLEIANRRLVEMPRSPRDHVPDLDPRWELAILRCLEQQPEQRFGAAVDVIQALDDKAQTRTFHGQLRVTPRGTPDSRRSRLGPYEIVEPLGASGMGEVYKAWDTRLNRSVAIKVLSPKWAADIARRQEFLQEARAACALNHPNVTAIHDIGIDNNRDYIVMEYVRGKTLDTFIPPTGMRFSELLKVAIQLADGVSAAHAVGIIHGDLKASNILISENGLVKILNFGLAKLVDHSKVAEERANSDAANPIGDTAYMSPEQAKGESIDVRSDIFSFGAVLYEMATHRHAFSGKSRAEMIAALIGQEPEGLRNIARGLPHEFDQIVMRCLRKEPAKRHQHMSDVRSLLEDLQEGSKPGDLQVARVSRNSRWWLWGAIAALFLTLAVGLGLWLSRTREQQPLRVVPLTAYPGHELWPSFSLDGNQVAFSWNGEKQENYDVYVRLVDGGVPLRLTSNPAPDIYPAWSPDGRNIAFIRTAAARLNVNNLSGGPVYLISPLGGTERKLTDMMTTSLAWMPDGKSLIISVQDIAGFSRLDLLDSNRINLAPVSLFQLAIDGTTIRRLTFPDPPPNNFGGQGTEVAAATDWMPAVSPDGQNIAFTRRGELHIMTATGGNVRRLTKDRGSILGMVWINNRVVLFSSDRRGTRTLWRIAADARSEPQPVAGIEGQGSYPTIAFSTKPPRRLAYARSTFDTNIWIMQLSTRDNGVARIVTAPAPVIGSTREDYSPDFSPDGKRIVFASDRSGYLEIWVSNTDGSNTEQLTTLASQRSGTPRWSPNGQNIAFDSLAAGNNDIWMVGAEGGAPQQLTTEPSNDARPSWSRDGRWIYFRTDRSGTQQIWKMPSTAPYKPAIQVTRNGGYEAFESFDGKLLYYIKPREGLWSVPVAGGTEVSVLKDVWHSHWRLAESGIYFLDFTTSLSSNSPAPIPLRFYSFTSHKLQTVYTLQKNVNRSIPGLAVTPDGRWILWSQIDNQGSDLTLVENF